MDRDQLKAHIESAYQRVLLAIDWGVTKFQDLLSLFPDDIPLLMRLGIILVCVWFLGALWRDIGWYVIRLPFVAIRNIVLMFRSPFGKARWATYRDLKKIDFVHKSGVFFGQWRGWLRRIDLMHQGEGHFITFALPGGGKTSSVIVPTLLSSTSIGSVVITDPKGEVTPITRRYRESVSRVVYINPFYEDYEADTGLTYPDTGFNPFQLIPKGRNAKAACDAFARLLCVTDRRGSETYWDNEGAELLSLMKLWIVRYEPPENQNLVYLYQLVRADPEETFGYMLHADDPQLTSEAERFLAMYRGAPAQWEGVKSKATQATRRYVPDTPLGDHVCKGEFDPKWLKQEDVTVYILLPTKHIKTGAPWLNMVIGLLGESVGAVGEARPVTFILEEAPALGFLPDLRAFMRQFRASGLRMWIISQTWSALAEAELYGKDGANDIFGLCATKQFFSISEHKHARHISQLCGETTELNRSHDEWTGKSNTSTVGVPLIRPEEIMNMKKGQQIIVRDGQPIKARLVPYFTRRKWRKITDKNPYLKIEKKGLRLLFSRLSQWTSETFKTKPKEERS